MKHRRIEDTAMLELSNKTNLLEQKSYRYSLQDIEHPNLYPDLFSYDEVPGCV